MNEHIFNKFLPLAFLIAGCGVLYDLPSNFIIYNTFYMSLVHFSLGCFISEFLDRFIHRKHLVALIALIPILYIIPCILKPYVDWGTPIYHLIDRLYYASFICLGILIHMDSFAFITKMNPGDLFDLIEDDTKLWHLLLKMLLCVMSFWLIHKWANMCSAKDMNFGSIVLNILMLIPWVGTLKYLSQIINRDEVKRYFIISFVAIIFGYVIWTIGTTI